MKRSKDMVATREFSLTDTVHVAGLVAMLGTAIYVLSRYQTTYATELVILGVASVAYLAILVSKPKEWLKLRYIDWFITVPLLVYAITASTNRSYWSLAVPVVLMLLFGFVGVLARREWMSFLLLGFAACTVFFVWLATAEWSISRWFLVFFATWFLYGLVDFLDGPYDNWAYTALDVINKPVFIICLLAAL